MENYPFTPFESDDKPEKTGEKKSARKKKKTTRVPLPVKPEKAKAASDEEESKPKLSDLFEKKPDKKDTEIAEPTETKSKEEDEDKSEPEGEVDDQKTDEEAAEIAEIELPMPESVDSDAESEASKDREEVAGTDIEDEFADETVIITRAETESPKEYKISEEPAEEDLGPAPKVAPPFIFPEVPSPKVPSEAGGSADTAAAEVNPAINPAQAEAVARTEYYETVPSEPAASEYRRFVEETRENSAQASPDEVVITRSELNRSNVRAEKRGLRRGVLTGGIVGWMIGRRGRKEAEREAETALGELNKTKKELSEEQAAAQQRVESIKRRQEQIENRVKEASASKAEVPTQTPEGHPAVLQDTGSETAGPVSSTELQPSQTHKETLEKAKAEQNPKSKEILPEEKPIEEDTYKVPDGRRVESSAWHRVEIDEKTGRAVENPSVEYGEEFHKEQKQEKMSRDAAEPVVAAQLGTAVLQGTANSDINQANSTNKTSEPEKSKQTSAFEILKDTEFVKQQLVQRTKSPSTWLTALALVVLLFLLGILR